ncbi:MAG: MFS transporter, partial [Natronospirillum sp.]
LVGRYIDRVPLTRYLLFVGTGLITAMLVLANSVGYASLLLAFFLLRLFGQGLLPHAGQTVMARQFEADRGKALSIASTGRPLGEVLLPSFILLTMAILNWRSTWMLYALIGATIFLPLLLLLAARTSGPEPVKVKTGEDQPTNPSLQPMNGHTVTQVLQDLGFWLILPVMLAAPLITTGVFIHQGFVLFEKSWEPEQFALGFILYGSMHWISMLCTGVFIDRFSAVAVSKVFMVPLTLAVAILAFFDGIWAIFAFMFLAGTSVGAMGPVSGALWAEVYGVANLGAIRSIIIALMVFATAVAPFSAGLAIDAGVSMQSMLTTVLVGMAAALVAAFVAYRRPANPTQSERGAP